jgi:CRP/FNR family cyclic AMP-dependent transcriptional regulator
VQTDALVLGGVGVQPLPAGEQLHGLKAVLRGLVQRLRSADRKIESLALMNVYGRVANVLLECAPATRRQRANC